MKYHKICLALFFAALNGYAEVSAFGAGDLNAKNPYGLSESEKVIYANKKATLENSRQIKKLTYKVDQISESIEGLRSVVDALNEKVGQTGQKLMQIDSNRASTSDDAIMRLKEELAAQKEHSAKITTALQKLTVMIDDIRSNYVSRSELSTSKKKVTEKSVSSKNKKHISNKKRLEQAIKNFRSKNYADAEIDFTILSDNNYKRATSNYYLGECAYYQKKYESAIVYYKKSAGLYDKASYMPTLLLHTGLAFEKLGDRENAKRFLEAVVSTYPKTSQAKMAKQHIR